METTILVLIGWALAVGSPGPATLAISSRAMSHGRRAGLVMATGVIAGSATWGIAAALGMSAVMLANAWIFEIVRYAGALYLLHLAVKSLRRAIAPADTSRAVTSPARKEPSDGAHFLQGYVIHVTNPKAILAWGAIYAIALPTAAEPVQVWALFGFLVLTSMTIFGGYGVLFSSAHVSAAYLRLRRWFDGAFAVLFGAASLNLLTARIL
ncbi:MAG: LysE family translocator [Rhodobacteraceae bacterium]|nr:LysE family translocator [Paracoccaceae bacterium]